MVKEIFGTYKLSYHSAGPDHPPIEIDFTPPFKRISMISYLESKINVKIPSDLASEGLA